MRFVIANSTPLIALAKIHELKILKEIYSQIVIPKAVYEEVAILGKGREGSVERTKEKWIKVKDAREEKLKKLLQMEVGGGEAEVIALAYEVNADLIVSGEQERR